jgi:hypothetical protein
LNEDLTLLCTLRSFHSNPQTVALEKNQWGKASKGKLKHLVNQKPNQVECDQDKE